MLYYVMFDVSRVTYTAGWIENELNLLVILNSFITVIFMYFTVCIGLDCVLKLLFHYSIWITNL